MKKYLYRAGSLTLISVIVLHYLWALLLFLATDHLNTTPLAFIIGIAGQHWASLVLVIAATMGLYGLTRPGLRRGFWVMLPQTVLMLLSGSSAIVAALRGRYPDGTIPIDPHRFILSDQLPMLVLVACYSASLMVYHAGRWTVPRS